MGKCLVDKRRAEDKCNRKEFHCEYSTKYLKSQDKLRLTRRNKPTWWLKMSFILGYHGRHNTAESRLGLTAKIYLEIRIKVFRGRCSVDQNRKPPCQNPFN